MKKKEAVISVEEQEIYIKQLLEPEFMKVIYAKLHSMKVPSDLFDDVSQNTLIKAYTRIEIYDPSKSKLITWVCNIARIEFFQAYNKRKEYVARNDGDASLFDNLEYEEDMPMGDNVLQQYNDTIKTIHKIPVLQKYPGMADDFIEWHSSTIDNGTNTISRPKLRELAIKYGITLNGIKTIWKRTREDVAKQMETN